MTSRTEVLVEERRDRRAHAWPSIRAAAARWHLALPAVLTAALALRAGGFFPGTVGTLDVVLLLMLVGRITLARRSFEGWSPTLAISAGALGLLCVWTLLSATWSHAPFRAASEFDRTLAYVLVLCLMGSFAARAGDLDRALRWLAVVVGGIALAALMTRLFPATFPIEAGRAPSRLAFPLTYWNSLGIFCAVGLVLALHCSAGGAYGRVTRVLAAGALPVIAVTLYFTFSRGGIAAAVVGLVAYVALVTRAGWPRRCSRRLRRARSRWSPHTAPAGSRPTSMRRRPARRIAWQPSSPPALWVRWCCVARDC